MPKGKLPSFMIAAIAILLLAALAGVYLLLQSANEPFPGAGTIGAAPSQQQIAPANPPAKIECSGSEKKSCTAAGCPGTKTCYGGAYGECVRQRKICVPGSKIGCSTDACKFGYATCNPCGSGYGECLPPQNRTSSNASCTGATCQ